MRSLTLAALVLTAVGASSASAMTHPMMAAPGFSGQAAVSDPDERLDRLAAASTRGDQSHAKPAKSVRSVLKDDPYLRAAYAYLDNR